jgi:hypothetical protein
MSDDTGLRTWEQTEKGWASRPATTKEKQKQVLFRRWWYKELTYQEVLEQIKALDL